MVTVVYRVVTKPENEEAFKKIAQQCVECARESADCLYYNFFQSLTDPKEFIVYYRFTSKEAQDKHIENLHQKIGPAKTGRDLPIKFLGLLQDEEVILFTQ